MNSLTIAGSVLAICTSSFGQNFVSSPPGFTSVEGNRYTYHFGGYADARFVFFDGEFRNHPMILKEVAYRLDGRSHSAYDSEGRSWKNVTLHVAEADYGKLGPLSHIFTLNGTRNPTKVFSGSVSWASHVGTPSSKPATFDRTFPFGAGGTASSYTHTGAKDIALDYDFKGGTLVSGYPQWTSSRSAPYFLDSYNNNSFNYNTVTFHGPSQSGGCVDSGSSRTYGAYNAFFVHTFGPDYALTSFKNKFRIYSYSFLTGPNAPVIHAYSIRGNSTGTTFPGTTCQKLFLNPAGMILQASRTANPAGYSDVVYPTGTQLGLLPYYPAAAGIPLWQQCAWADTKNGQLKLTRAIETRVPGLPKKHKRSVVYQYQQRLKPYYGLGPFDYFYMNPIARYAK